MLAGLQFDVDGGATRASTSLPVLSTAKVTGASWVFWSLVITTPGWLGAATGVSAWPCSSNRASYVPTSIGDDVLGLFPHANDATEPDRVVRLRSSTDTKLAPTSSHTIGRPARSVSDHASETVPRAAGASMGRASAGNPPSSQPPQPAPATSALSAVTAVNGTTRNHIVAILTWERRRDEFAWNGRGKSHSAGPVTLRRFHRRRTPRPPEPAAFPSRRSGTGA